MLNVIIIFLVQFSNLFPASPNGQYYKCDPDILTNDNYCLFIATSQAPAEWGGKVMKHNVNRSVGVDFYRQVADRDGTALQVTPKPWTDGTRLVASSEQVTGAEWNYALAFELIAPLRDYMMFNNRALTDNPSLWAKYTRAFTDCQIKVVDDNSGEHGTAYSTANVYEHMKDPKGQDIHHFILRYLEEGSIQLVCLMTSLDMPKMCDPIRCAWSINKGSLCNCMYPAYNAIYGSNPAVDQTFKTCVKLNDTAVCSASYSSYYGWSHLAVVALFLGSFFRFN